MPQNLSTAERKIDRQSGVPPSVEEDAVMDDKERDKKCDDPAADW
eukprot:CAMPEP_0171406388 /NCGR_PEP_ID=MMETSP0880-20121228/17646_1 /TAXON_ID=67004 /ORGANISM="Thalassiosira weissflogii, Strain CCMP1336" /LENGTH=44 /DNA_ID= /DNA_START= /DNA_END= /DNA_ORIENTATION=